MSRGTKKPLGKGNEPGESRKGAGALGKFLEHVSGEILSRGSFAPGAPNPQLGKIMRFRSPSKAEKTPSKGEGEIGGKKKLRLRGLFKRRSVPFLARSKQNNLGKERGKKPQPGHRKNTPPPKKHAP